MKDRFIDIRLSDLPTDFVRLAGHILRGDPAQLAVQLSSRLSPGELRALSPQLQFLAASAPFRLLHQSIARVGGPLLASWTTDGYTGRAVLNADDTVYVRLSDHTIAAWNLDREAAPYFLADPGGPLAFNPLDKSVAWGRPNGDVAVGEQTWHIHDNAILDFAIAGNGWAVSLDTSYLTKVWDANTGQVLQELEPPDEDLRSRLDETPSYLDEGVGFGSVHMTSTRVLFCSGSMACAWNLQSGSICWHREIDTLNAGAFAVSPGGRMVLIDSTLVDIEDGRSIGPLEGNVIFLGKEADAEGTQRAVFSLDGTRLYTTERYDPRIYVREPVAGRTLGARRR